MSSQNQVIQKGKISGQKLLLKLRFVRLLLTALLLCIFYTASAAGQADAGASELRQVHKHHISQLPDLLTTDQNEQSIENDISYEGRIVVVTFFASWCPPCLAEFKALNIVNSELGADNITVVALNVFEEFDDNDEARMEKFLHNTQPEFTVLKGNEETRELFGGIKRIPTLLVFDKAGKQAFNFVHKRGAKKQTVDASELLDAIRPLL